MARKRAESTPVVHKGERHAAERHLVILTGVSGSGKGSVLRGFEDNGYYCVDNLPLELLPTFAELVLQSPEIERAALVVDVREVGRLVSLPEQIARLRQSPLRVSLIFLDASEEALVRRFSETRRPHPLGHRDLRAGIRAERRRLARLRKLADLVIDTSPFNVRELRDYVEQKIIHANRERALRIGLISFGYRYGLPADADLVLDVRFLPNPNYIPRLRHHSGRDPKVAAFIRRFPQTREFLNRTTELLLSLIPHYIEEGKSYLTIALGCTGGQHRSVMMAEEIGQRLRHAGYHLKVQHRDLPLATLAG